MTFNSHDVPWTPTLKDMEAPQALNAAKIKGEYASLQEWAEIHYHLLKEDFMRPIRDGIERYKECGDIHSQGLRFYSNVRIVDISFLGKIHHRLQFDSSAIATDQWIFSSCLAGGSLLLLSCNKFENFVFATVTHSTVKLLTQGFIDVEFIPDKDALSHLLASSSGPLVMAESTTNYYSYCHVLSALKQSKMCSRLQEYIIKGSQRIERPSYLTLKAKYDMSCIMKKERACSFEPLKPLNWPEFRETCLNESQRAAVQLALTKELAVIQGPPGTGKTFVCRKIIQTLVRNSKSPILLLCKTNNALDEILEWVLEFCTSDIIRCAGVNISGKLESVNFDTVLTEMEENRAFTNKELMSKFWQCAQMLARISQQIAKCYHQLESLEKEIQSPEVLMEHMNHSYREAIKRGKWSVQTVCDWLCENEHDKYENQQKLSTKNRVDNHKKVLQELSKNTTVPMSEKEEGKVKNIKLLKLQQRLGLYKLWTTKYRKQLSEKVAALLNEYHTIHDQVHIIRKQKVIDVLQNHSLIGMTPITAARYSTELKAVMCKIVIVDDAASMFESDILAAINQWCEHLILVGDRQLVGPAPAVVDLSDKYGLGVSLVERLIQNNIPYVQLDEQYKICPDIAELKRHIYTNLKDNKYPLEENDISGISKNMFFIDHNHKGSRCVQTGKEVHICEADFLVAFCKYLIFMRHPRNTIAILTTNVDQMLIIKERITCVMLGRLVLVATVDKYRKQENDIILLSFIRSKEEIAANLPINVSKVSHAFSIAKRGFYAIGDFDSLRTQSKQWTVITDSAIASGHLADGLPLSCGLNVTCSEGFNMYISYMELQAAGSNSGTCDFSESTFTVNDMKAALFRMKCEYCMFKIDQLETIAVDNEKFNNLDDKIDTITENMSLKQRNKLKLEISSLLYLVVITELEHICLNKKQKFKEGLKMPITFWKEKLSFNEVDEEMVDSADDFVEKLMISMMKGGKHILTKVMNIAIEVDKISLILFSKDSQAICDLIEKKSRRKFTLKQVEPQIEPLLETKGEVVHGRQLHWYLADKTSIPCEAEQKLSDHKVVKRYQFQILK